MYDMNSLGLVINEDSVDPKYLPYVRLGTAMILQYSDEYKEAIKVGDHDTVSEIEEFFHSDLFKLITNVNPNFILRRLKADAEAEM